MAINMNQSYGQIYGQVTKELSEGLDPESVPWAQIEAVAAHEGFRGLFVKDEIIRDFYKEPAPDPVEPEPELEEPVPISPDDRPEGFNQSYRQIADILIAEVSAGRKVTTNAFGLLPDFLKDEVLSAYGSVPPNVRRYMVFELKNGKTPIGFDLLRPEVQQELRDAAEPTAGDGADTGAGDGADTGAGDGADTGADSDPTDQGDGSMVTPPAGMAADFIRAIIADPSNPNVNVNGVGFNQLDAETQRVVTNFTNNYLPLVEQGAVPSRITEDELISVALGQGQLSDYMRDAAPADEETGAGEADGTEVVVGGADAAAAAATDEPAGIPTIADLAADAANITNIRGQLDAGRSQQDIEAYVGDILLRAGYSPAEARANMVDLAFFLSNNATLQRTAEEAAAMEAESAPAEEPVVEEPVVEEPVVEEPVVEEPPIGTDTDPVVVTDPAGSDVPTTGTEEDINEIVPELLSIINDMPMSNLDDLKAVKDALGGIFEEYGVAIEDLANAEAASNIIDEHIEVILSNALNASETLFSSFDNTQEFGREAQSGLELSMERILNQLEFDKEDLLAKTGNLVNLRYDQALERLGRAGLLEGGGIAASGANVRQAEEIEAARAQELIAKELEVDEKLRAELRETVSLMDAIQRSRTDEAISQQQSRIDTTQQLLDFITDLENLRLGSRSVAVQEDSLSLDEYRAKADERLREAELTGDLDGQETLALREMLSRVQLENRRIELETKISSRELSVSERAMALQELVEIKKIGLEAKRVNLEEALGLQGMSLQERRLTLDELLGNAGIDVEERKLVLDELLGTGDLAIRRDMADLEERKFTTSDFLERRKLQIEEHQLSIENGQINRRMALEERRLEFDRFVEGNRVNLTRNQQRIDELSASANFNAVEYERELGWQRLANDGQRIDIEERRQLMEETVSMSQISFEERRMAFEEIMVNKEFSLKEREYYLTEMVSKTNLTQRDKELATDLYLARAQKEQGDRSLDIQEREIGFDERMRISEATGVVIDQNGYPVPTLAAKGLEIEERMRQAGLDMEAEKIRNSYNQWNRQFNEDAERWMSEFALTAQEADDRRAVVYQQMELARQDMELRVEESIRNGFIDMQSLGIRQGELDLSKIQVSNEKERSDAQLRLDAQTLSATIGQQDLDRSFEMKRHNDRLGWEEEQFNRAIVESDREWAAAVEQAAIDNDLDAEEFALAKYQIEQDVLLRQISLEDAAAHWSAEFGLEQASVDQALRQADQLHYQQLRSNNIAIDMSEEQYEQFLRERQSFEKQEAARDEMYELAMDKDALKSKSGRRQLAALLAIVNGGTGVSGGGGGGGGGIKGFAAGIAGDAVGIFSGEYAKGLAEKALGK